MNTELILLIISLFSNAVIILKKIKVIWTPCLIISCTSEIEEMPNSEGVRETQRRASLEANETQSRIKQILNKLTPRKKNETQPEVIK